MQTTSVYSHSPIAIKGATTEGYCYFGSILCYAIRNNKTNKNSLGLSWREDTS